MPREKKKHLLADGTEVRSGFERKVAARLSERGVPFQYESEKIKYEVPSSTHVYTPDFILPNGVICEAKGVFDLESRKKMELVIQQYPDKDIRMLFMRDNYINRKSKTKYSDWCAKRGVKCHVSALGEVPDDWINSD